jgi:hypothetical protein
VSWILIIYPHGFVGCVPTNVGLLTFISFDPGILFAQMAWFGHIALTKVKSAYAHAHMWHCATSDGRKPFETRVPWRRSSGGPGDDTPIFPKHNDTPNWTASPVLLAYQPPANSTFLSEQTSHQQPARTSQQFDTPTVIRSYPCEHDLCEMQKIYGVWHFVFCVLMRTKVHFVFLWNQEHIIQR